MNGEQLEEIKKIYQRMNEKKDHELEPWEKYIKQERRKTKKLLRNIKENEVLTDFDEEGGQWRN